MKSIVTTTFLILGLAATAGVQPAFADSLSALNSACRTGDFAACSRYNAAIIARSSAQNPVMMQGYDPFAIVPATHSVRTPSRPAGTAADIAAGKSPLKHQETKKVQ